MTYRSIFYKFYKIKDYKPYCDKKYKEILSLYLH